MSDPKTREALELALGAEKQSLRAYLGFARATQDPGGKDMFIRLAQDEFDHMTLLEKQTAALAEKGSCVPLPVEPSYFEKLVPRLSDKSLRIRGRAGQNQLSALRTALELENSARWFYLEQSQTVESAPARQMFARLSQMEQAHAELIQAEIDSIQETGFWFSTREFTLEGER